MNTPVEKAVSYFRKKYDGKIHGVISTGSGQSLQLNGVRVLVESSYSDIPGFSETSIEGHDGICRIVESNNRSWLFFIGRRHFYQGYSYSEITGYIDIAHVLGARRFLCINSSGGLIPELNVGDLSYVERFKNFNPVVKDPVQPDGGSWKITSEVMNSELIEASEETGIPLKAGSYAGVPGPTYETRADAEWLRNLGCTLVGMSTVPELIRGIELGMDVSALALVTNIHNGSGKVSHSEVVENARKGASRLEQLVKSFLELNRTGV